MTTRSFLSANVSLSTNLFTFVGLISPLFANLLSSASTGFTLSPSASCLIPFI